MTTMNKRYTFLYLVAFLSTFLPHRSWAQSDTGFRSLREDLPTKQFTGDTLVQDLTGNIVNVLLGVVGAAAFAMLVVGGVQLIIGQESGGDKDGKNSINAAKKTIVWAAAGLVAVFAAYIIVNFVITSLTGATGISS